MDLNLKSFSLSKGRIFVIVLTIKLTFKLVLTAIKMKYIHDFFSSILFTKISTKKALEVL